MIEDAAEAAIEAAPSRGIEPRKTRTWQLTSIAAAIAAAAVLTPMVQTRWAIRQRDTAMRALIATSPGTNRPIEPRLTGGFPYAEKPVVERGDKPETAAQQMIFESKAYDVIDRTEHDRTPAGKHARGIAWLELKKPANAVADLTTFTNLHPNDATGWSDLSAARYVAGDRAGAGAAAERAIKLDPKLNEAWFNRALAVNTIAAWNDYLAHDPKGPWADEARAKIENLNDFK